MSLLITSSAFSEGNEIPSEYTCDGKDISPPLNWTEVPSAAKSLVLIVDDPDAPDPAAPKMTWIHWLLYNLPAKNAEMPEAAGNSEPQPGVLQGLNSWSRTGYGGPCPPIGRHRYFFKLYALDTELTDLGHPDVDKLQAAMKGHVLEESILIGTYQH